MTEKRWISGTGFETDKTKLDKVEAFLADILAVYEKHKMSLGHEDNHGSFLIEKLSKENTDWLNAAAIDRGLAKDL